MRLYRRFDRVGSPPSEALYMSMIKYHSRLDPQKKGNKMSKKRRYNEDYLKFGFTYCTDKDGLEKPQCFLCARVLCNDNMRPNKLHEHFIRMHPGNSEDSLEILKQKKARFHSSTGTIIPELGNNFAPNINLNSELGLLSTGKNNTVLETSYKIAYIIAKNKMSHTVAEKIIKPCALEMVEDVLGIQHRKQIAEIPMSKDVISSRIKDMAADVLEQLVEELQKTNLPFGIQLDESTDEPECGQLLVFVRYATNMCIKDEMLFSEPLSNTTKPRHVLELIDEFFTKNNLDWKTKLGFICTDGASSVLGKQSGFGDLVKTQAPKVVLLHCFLNQHALASKTLPPRIKSALRTVTQSVNFVRSRAPNHEIFKTLCQEVGVVLCNTETRWLSHGRVLTRVMELKPEIAEFLRDKDRELYGETETESFAWSLAYLADISSHLNDLNVSVQGVEVSCVDASEKISAFKQKLELWKRRLAKRNYANFPTLEKLLSTDANFNQKFSEWIQGDISKHMDNLVNYLDEYTEIQDVSRHDGWIRNPFTFNLDTMDDDDMQKDDLIDLQSKALLMQNFFIQNLDEFWCSQMLAYPALAKKALLSLIPPATNYLCQSGFLTLISLKTKSRNRLDAKHDLRLALSKIIPRISSLANKKQQHPSH